MKDFRFNERTRSAVPHGDVQRSEPSGVGQAHGRLGHTEPDSDRSVRPHSVHQPIAPDPVRAEVLLLSVEHAAEYY